MNRPRRQRKGDRLTNPDATASQIEIDHALAPFDEASRAMDRKWGIDRLPALVSETTAARFGKGIGMLNDAIRDEDSEKVQRLAGQLRKFIGSMDAEATENGSRAMPLRSASCEFEGRIFTVIQEIADIQNYEKQENEMVFTIREFAVVMKAMRLDGELANATKKYFPQSQITDFKSKLGDNFWKEGGDEIPF